MKQIRRAMSPEEKQHKDKLILSRLQSLYQYKRCDTVLCYVSTEIEVDTKQLITEALKDGKRVAVPRCIDGTREMTFHYINSLDELEPRTFSVLEPLPEKSEMVKSFKNSICIIPALAYDEFGYRLGYGGGYYDRFLSKYPGVKIGIIYNACVKFRLFHGKYDVPADIIITERYVKRAKNKPMQ